ncbi:MAG: NAD-dependent malic enzyme [candidate division NC10 bacterium]|nr:NAD-dependent malic enzyme [candidate division NC10 bacterium]MBI2163773.1 NAD-dependent malic enzyme [candidate division NC10 bacterium]MBI2457163.1 NAD-dependent malic enzyme [candidate division NC10 bacterium]
MHIEKNADKLVKTMRVFIQDQPGNLGRLCTAIGEVGGNIGEVKTVALGLVRNTRDLTVYVDDEAHLQRVVDAIRPLPGIELVEVIDEVLKRHEGGKIAVTSRYPLESIADMRKVYTPGVATVCRLIQANPTLAHRYTAIGNTVAIVTNGTAILGLGAIGPVAGMPVMEGKALLLERLVGINGVPILVDTRDPDEFVEAVVRIAPTFGAVNLEDVAAPDCFEIEARVQDALDIPVMHDDQHGTAVVVLASLLKGCALSGLSLAEQTVGIIGLGAAGMGIAKLLLSYGIRHLIGTDLKDEAMGRLEQAGGKRDSLEGVMARATIVVATTGAPGLIRSSMIRKGQVILALSNPNAEIRPEEALAAGAAFAVDGKMVNNALAFPGIFRGALDARVRRITDAMKVAAAEAIAAQAPEGELVPEILDRSVHQAVARAVALAS